MSNLNKINTILTKVPIFNIKLNKRRFTELIVNGSLIAV